MQKPKTSFSNVFKDLQQPNDIGTDRSAQMAWHTIVKQAIAAIGGSVVDRVVGIGKQAVEDTKDVLDDAAKDIRDTIVSDDALENLTFDYIVNMKADDLQYLARKVAKARRALLRVEAYTSSAAKMQYRYKIKTELTDDQVEQVEALIESFILSNSKSNP